MTTLKDILLHSIATDGPLPLNAYMEACLMHPEFGYYVTRDPFGQGGDFVTAPEISQMFGELLGLALAQIWIDQDAPSKFILAELGPGRGTLMSDILRATQRVPGFHDAAQIVLIETSQSLRATQASTLNNYRVAWGQNIADLPDGPVFLVANEFFDALPIFQYRRTSEGWETRVVTSLDAGLALDWAKPGWDVSFLRDRELDCEVGDVVEHCPLGQQIVGQIAKRVASDGGVALILDYGDKRSLGDTLQAMSNHAPTNPVQDPGNADITAHVDFGALADAAIEHAPQIRISGLTTQGVLLERLGITARAEALARNLAGDALESHIAAHRRLTHPAEMGTLFKGMALTPRGTPPPPAFDP